MVVPRPSPQKPVVGRRIVGALLVSHDGHVLLGYKDPSAGGAYSDCWVLPGGGVEPGEADLQALRREVLEEVGIDITPFNITLLDNTLTGTADKIDKNTGQLTTFRMQFIDYRVDAAEDARDINIKPGDDLAKVEWIPFRKLHQYQLSASAEKLLRDHGFIQQNG